MHTNHTSTPHSHQPRIFASYAGHSPHTPPHTPTCRPHVAPSYSDQQTAVSPQVRLPPTNTLPCARLRTWNTQYSHAQITKYNEYIKYSKLIESFSACSSNTKESKISCITKMYIILNKLLIEYIHNAIENISGLLIHSNLMLSYQA